ncbi:WD40/YVTN/BNR-like repeat-containing protein [Variovorax sp. GB1P17]|uniref:WD40/YVTN/BNR-like repeat-containing protein n=1 Tax=Variovorax sp. GB1P17 TaxID=3443740 RepID=UPI003F449371
MKGTILVGTAGQGILRSADDGASWHRLGLKEAIEFDGVVRCLLVDPSDPRRIFAGADAGICLSDDAGAHFRRLESPANGMHVWAMAIDPRNPAVIYAGTGAPSRACMFRSLDAGASWVRLPIELPEFCAGVNRPRILTVVVDPDDSSVWFGVEEGGAWHSLDQGESWRRADDEASSIVNGDIHAITILPVLEGRPKMHLATTVNSVYTNLDGGYGRWEGASSAERFGMYYTRTVVRLEGDQDVLLVAVGDGTPGTQTHIWRSEDRGISWADTLLHARPNSTFWALGTHPADPQLVFAGTKYGHLFRSVDGGRSWSKDWRDFSEITSVAWTPVVAEVKAHPKSTLGAVHV